MNCLSTQPIKIIMESADPFKTFYISPISMNSQNMVLQLRSDQNTTKVDILSADNAQVVFTDDIPTVSLQKGDLVNFFSAPANPTSNAGGFIFTQKDNMLYSV